MDPQQQNLPRVFRSLACAEVTTTTPIVIETTHTRLIFQLINISSKSVAIHTSNGKGEGYFCFGTSDILDEIVAEKTKPTVTETDNYWPAIKLPLELRPELVSFARCIKLTIERCSAHLENVSKMIKKISMN